MCTVPRSQSRPSAASLVARALVVAIVGLSSGLPLLWLVAQVLESPSSIATAWLDPFHLRLLGRTLGYNAAVAVVATVIALPAAIVLGRGGGWASRLLMVGLPVSLLMPSIAYAYGWSQFLRLSRVSLEPAGVGDVVRCILTLAAWLWPLPAGVMGLALRRTDVNLQQQALLDGALGRFTARLLLGPAAAGFACVMVLATQEFAVYEPTGISVVATEVRIVFETGLFSSPTNPITAPSDPESRLSGDQAARATAAVATALPLLVAMGLLGAAGIWGVRRFSAADDLDPAPPRLPRPLRPGKLVTFAAFAVLTVTLLTPIVSMLLSLQRPIDAARVWRVFAPQVGGSMALAGLAAAGALVLALAACVGRPRVALGLSLLTFLLGGQLLAIALIRLYNRPWLGWVYDGPPIVAMAYLARFGWLALLAALATRSRPWQQVRDLAAIDGASEAQGALHVVWPLAWPTLGAGAVLVGVLSLTEVPATVLISPLEPWQPLVPLLMTWVHMLRYDDMLEGALLMMAAVGVLASAAVALVWLGRRAWGGGGGVKGQGSRVGRSAPLGVLCLLSSILVLTTTGCGDGTKPDAVWLDTGAGPGQTVYPRAISYSPTDDTFFVIDRLARVQHLDRDGQYLGEWQMPEHVTGKPVGVSVGPDGNVYVPDTHYQRVVVYDPHTKAEIRRWGSFGKGPGQFIYPTDIAFDSKGNVFVSEYGDNDRVQVFTPEGKFLYAFGSFGPGDGQLARPQSILIDKTDTLYVTDACNHRVGVFKTDGTFVRNLGTTGSELGQFRYPYGLAEGATANPDRLRVRQQPRAAGRQGHRPRPRRLGCGRARRGRTGLPLGRRGRQAAAGSWRSTRGITGCRCSVSERGMGRINHGDTETRRKDGGEHDPV